MLNVQSLNIQHSPLQPVERTEKSERRPGNRSTTPRRFCLRFASFDSARRSVTRVQDSAPFQVRSALLFFQIEQVVGPDRLMSQPPYCRDDRGDAAARRFHPSHSDPQEVLPAIPRFACEVRRFDPAAFQVLLESCRHVQYSASYVEEG